MARLDQLLLSLLLLGSAALLGLQLLPREADPLPVTSEKAAAASVDGQADSAESEPLATAAAGRRPIDDFGEVVARPLFFRSRRPPPPVTREQKEQAKASARSRKPLEKPPFSVMGIIIDGDDRVALIKPVVKNGEVMRVKEGGIIKGWTVSRIGTDAVTVRRDDAENLVRLSDNLLSPDQKRRLKQQAAQNRARERGASNQARKLQRNGSKRRRVILDQERPGPPNNRQPTRGQTR